MLAMRLQDWFNVLVKRHLRLHGDREADITNR
jgi:hypothetical protein